MLHLNHLFPQMKPYEVVSCVKLNHWEDVQRLPELFNGWLFRGQRDQRWSLQSTLERACERLRPDVTIAEVERDVLRTFQGRASEFCQACPGAEDALEWFSLLQHHGGPTRLLDFSESVYVAAFFALGEAEGDSAIWAMNNIMIHVAQVKQWMALHPERLKDEVLRITLPSFNDVYHERVVWNGHGAGISRPIRRTGRIDYQSGVFVHSLNMKYSLEENLYGMHGAAAEQCRQNIRAGYHTSIEHPRTIERLKQLRVVKFILPQSIRREGLRELRKMGIDYTGLFRDLDGFARAMGHEVYDLTTDPE